MAKKLWFLVLILAAFALVTGCASSALAYPNPFNSYGEDDGFIDTAQDLSPPIQDKTFVSNLSVASTFDTLVAMSVPVAGQYSMVLPKRNDTTNENTGLYQNVAILPAQDMSGSKHYDVSTMCIPITLTVYGHQEVAVPTDLAGYYTVYFVAKSGASPLIAIAGNSFDLVNTDSILAADIGPPSTEDYRAECGSPTQEVWQPNIGEKSTADNSSDDAEKVPKLGYSENTAVVCENNLV